jgi:glycosyltransferase involved in cell wall biosynthesis
VSLEKFENKKTPPRLSIISIVRNDRTGIRRTVSALLNQTFENWELIIVDGNSEDGSRESAMEFAYTDKRVVFRNQISSGIYQAMNEGLELAKGEFVWFMNAGDIFYDEKSVSESLVILENSEVDILVGGYGYYYKGNLRVFQKNSKVLNVWEVSLNRRGLCHQSMIYRTNKLREIGGYEVSFSLVADFYSALRIATEGKIQRTSKVLSIIELGGISQSLIHQVLSEKQRARKSIFSGQNPQIILGRIWTVAVIIKMRLAKVKK